MREPFDINAEDYKLPDSDENESIDVTEEELEALKTEIHVLNDGNHKAFGQELLDQNVPKAVLQLVKLAQHATAERVRLDASKYIVERVLGPLTKLDPTKDLENDPPRRRQVLPS